MAGLTSTGFTPKSMSTIIEEMTQALIAIGLDPIDVRNPDSLAGELVAILAEREVNLWDLGDDIYASRVPQNATGILLDNLAAVLGLTRQEATPTTVLLTLTGTAGTSIPLGSLVTTSDGFELETLETVVLPASVLAGSTLTGAFTITAGTVTVISTPITGWTAVTNAAAGIPGAARENDDDLLARMVAERSRVGAGTVESMRSRLLELDQVQSVNIIENVTAVEVDGAPPYGILVVVFPDFNEDTAIAQTIWDTKPAGTATGGDVTVSIEDSQGFDHNVSFSYVTEIDVEFTLTYVYDAADFPDDGEAQIDVVVEDYITSLGVGESANAYKLMARIFSEVTGMVSWSVATFTKTVPTTVTAAVLTLRAADKAVSEGTHIYTGVAG